MIVIEGRTKKNNIVVAKVNDNRYRITVYCVKGSGGSSTIPGTPGNFVAIGSDNKPVDSTKKHADYDSAGTAAAAINAHLSAAPHKSALSEMTEDTTHRVVTDTEKSTWNGKEDSGTAAAAVNAHLSAAPHKSALSEMSEDTTHRVVTDTEKSTWNGKEDSGTAAAAVSAHLSAAPHKSALSEMSDDSTHRVVTDTEKSTWNGKQDALGFTPENSSNKKTSLTDSDTDYPTTKAVNTGLAGKMTKLPVATEYIVTVKDAGGDSYADIPTDDFWITNSTLIAALLDSGNWTGTTYSGTTTGAVEGQMYVGTTHLFIFKDSTFHRFAKV